MLYCAITEGLRNEEHPIIFVQLLFRQGLFLQRLLESISDEELKSEIVEVSKIGIEPASIARAIAFAIEQPSEVAINEMIVRPTIQEL